MKYWLFKSEPETFSIDTLSLKPKQTEHWDGVRNYQARNFMKNDMKIGDMGFFYHSNCKIPGIAGTIKIVKEAYPDFSSLDPTSKYFDPKSSKDNPRWFMVDVQLDQIFPKILSLTDLRCHPKLDKMLILRTGNRLSITPVTKAEWKTILEIATS